MRRVTYGALGVGGVLLLLALLASSPFWLIRSPAARNRALDASGLAQILGGSGGTQRVRVDRMARFGLLGLRLEGARVERLGPAGWEAWARVGSVDLAWRPEAFFTKQIFLSRVLVDSVWVDLRLRPAPLADATPARRPEPAPRPPRRIEDSLWPVRISDLQVRDAVLIDGEGRRREASLEATGIDFRRGRFQAMLQRAGLRAVPESLQVALAGGLVDGQVPNRAAVKALSIESPGLRARLDASWDAAEGAVRAPGRVSAHLELRELRPTQIAAARALSLPWHPTDAISGRIDVHGTAGGGLAPRVECDVELGGSVFGTGLDTLLATGSASPDTADLRELRLRLGSIGLSGSTRWVRSGTSRANLRFRGIDLGSPPLSLFAGGMPVSDFAGSIRAEADSLGPRLHLRAEVELEPGNLLNRPISGLLIRARLDPRVFAIEDLRTREEPPALEFAGTLTRAAPTISATGALRDFALEDWVAPWLTIPLEGRIDGPFRIEGPLSAPRVEGAFSGRRGRVVGVYVDSLRAAPMAGTLRPLRLQGDFRGAGLDIYKVKVDSVAGGVIIADTITARFAAWRDTTRARLAVRVVPAVRGAVLLDSLSVRAGRLPEIALEDRVRLGWSPDEVRIDSLRLRMEAGRIGGRGWIRPRPGHPGTEPFGFAAEVADLDLGILARYFGLSAGDWAGTLSGRFDGTGTMTSPTYRFRADGTGLGTVDWAWDRVTVTGAAGEGIGIFIDSLRASGPGFTGALPGPEAVGPQAPGPAVFLRADSLFMRFASPWDEVMKALPDSSRRRTVLAAARLGGTIAMQRVPAAPFLVPLLGARAWGGRQSGLVESTNPMLDLIRVRRPSTEQNGAQANWLGGSIDLTARIGGTGRAPEASVDLVARRVHALQAWADSIKLRGDYANSMLTVERLDWHMGSSLLHLDAKLPYDIDLSVPAVRSVKEPRRLRAELKDVELSLLSLVPAVGIVLQEPRGRLNGWVMVDQVAGPGKLAGRLEVADGAFRIANREEHLRNIRAVALLDSAGLHVEELNGNLGDRGTVTAKGLFRGMKDFDLEAKVRDGLVWETGNYRFVAEGDFRARPVADGDSLRPQLTGDVRVLEGLITQDLAKPPRGFPARIPWLVDLRAVAPGNFRVNQPQADVDLGEGDLGISFRWPYWNLSGTMQVLGGRYRIFNRSLNVTSGTVEFQDTGLGPDPLLDVQAETTVAGQGDEPPIPVLVTVKGHPAKQELTVSLSSPGHPEYSEAQLIELLSVGQLTSGRFGTFTREDPTRQALSSELMGQVERQLVRQLPWIDRVQLEGQLGGTSPMRINLRPIVQPQWSVIYSQDLATSPEREVAVRYRLSNLLFLNAAVDRRRNEQGLTSDSYLLDLKLRFEY
jgi:hypothetical protein